MYIRGIYAYYLDDLSKPNREIKCGEIQNPSDIKYLNVSHILSLITSWINMVLVYLIVC